jgi:uncharacterized DUF497 family protein
LPLARIRNTEVASVRREALAMQFEWDDGKAEINWHKHGVHFVHARDVFLDPLAVTIHDPDQSVGEERLVIIGEVSWHRLLVVTFTHREDRIRIISARRATTKEKRRYMRGDQIRDEDEMRPEYDFSNGVRGLHHIPKTTRFVSIDEDVAAHFITSADINNALRELIAEGRVPPKRNE